MALPLPTVLATAPGMRAAELVIDGLAVLCFNSTNGEKFWEVAYPRRAQHQLTITVEPLNGADQPVEPIVPHQVPEAVRSFNISLSQGSLVHYDFFPQGGPANPAFNRSTANSDSHDLGWMIDVAGPELQHGNVLRLLPRDPSRPISLARIRHSLLCTLKPEDDDVRISPRNRNNPTASGSFLLGRNNTEIVGVLLAKGPGEIRFESDGAALNIDPLPYDENRRYRIRIINEDVQNSEPNGIFVKGDLHLLYDTVIEVDGEQKDLWARPVGFEPFGEPVFSAEGTEIDLPLFSASDGDCHPDKYGGTTLQPLIE
jgi:hypothetical protein